MSVPIFVTATGTDAGKTHILCALLRAARARGLAPEVLKPVHSGFDPAAAAASDSAALLRALDRDPTPTAIAAITPVRLRDPLSPDIAAAREGMELRLSRILADCAHAIAAARGPLFIEGAGGVMSPLARDGLNLDLIAALGARPLLVCGAYLGAISHTLTAVAAMRAAGAPPALILVNPFGATAETGADIAAALRRFGAPARIWSHADADAILTALDL